MGVTARTFPAPEAVGGGEYTLDELEALSYDDSDIAAWAGRIYRRERDKALTALSTDSKLPHAVTDADEYGHDRVVGLLYEDGVYTAQGWVDAEGLVASGQPLDADTTAFIARAFDEGVDHVYIRPWMPAGWITAAAAAEPPEGSVPIDGLPEGAIVAAIVDELDKNAVLDLIALAPGPVTLRRHDGKWREDDAWVHALRSVKPPPLVKIDDPSLLVGVVSQIDTATAGTPFSKDDEDSEEEAAPVAAAALLASIETADTVAAITAALVAAKSGKKLANKAAGAERLRQYWLHGKGAAKIRWGTPGDWTRCYRNLSKYMGPRAKGYCQLMHGRATGTWAGRNNKKTPNPAVKAKAIAKQLSR